MDLSQLGALAPSASLLALGGVGAAVVAGWNHVKTWFLSVKRLLIVEARFSHPVSGPMTVWIYSKWKPAPKGYYTFIGMKAPIRNKQYSYVIPFIWPGESWIALRRRQFLFISMGGEGEIHKISGIRGIVNMKALVAEALIWYNEEYRATITSSIFDRFMVTDVVGAEKVGNSMVEMVEALRKDKASEDTGSSSPVSAVTGSPGIHLDIQESFLYKKDVYTFSSEDNALEGLFYPDRILEQFEAAKNWLSKGDWYTKRFIPHRRGWLFHGPGGTGKSSLAKAIARYLKIPIYRYFLNTLSDQEFIKRWNRMDTPCIALIEDVDTVFRLRENLTAHKALSFETLLNVVSGVNTLNGILLIVTTNRLDYIDPALGVPDPETGESSRPGRIDQVTYIGEMEDRERRRMAQHILQDWPEEVEQLMARTVGVKTMPAQWMETCVQIATNRLKDEQ